MLINVMLIKKNVSRPGKQSRIPIFKVHFGMIHKKIEPQSPDCEADALKS